MVLFSGYPCVLCLQTLGVMSSFPSRKQEREVQRARTGSDHSHLSLEGPKQGCGVPRPKAEPEYI